MNLHELLRWITSSGGAGVIAYYILARVRWPDNVGSEAKRYVAIAVTFALADVCWLLMVWAGYDAMPVGALGWVEQLFLVGTTAFGLSQVIHGARDLRARDRA